MSARPKNGMATAAGMVIFPSIPWRISDTTRAFRGSRRAKLLMKGNANTGPKAAIAVMMCSKSQNVNHDHMADSFRVWTAVLWAPRPSPVNLGRDPFEARTDRGDPGSSGSCLGDPRRLGAVSGLDAGR